MKRAIYMSRIRPRRCVIIAHSDVVQGADGWRIYNRLGPELDGLLALGWEVRLVTFKGRSAPQLSYVLGPSIRVTAFKRGLLGSILVGIAGFVSALRADATLVFMPTLRAALVTIAVGDRAVIYAGSSWAESSTASSWRRAVEVLASRRCAMLIGAGDALVERYGRVVDTVPATPMVPSEVARLLGHPAPPRLAHTGPLRVLFVGNVSPRKGCSELVDALTELEEVVCHVVGLPEESEEGNALARSFAALPNVVMLGHLEWEGLQREYGWADVLVLPAHWEGFPRVLYEATAFGVAIVATSVGGIARRLRSGTDAVLVPVGDAAPLVAAIRGIDASRDSIPLLAESARIRLRGVFRDPSPAHQYDRCLRLVAADRERRQRRVPVRTELS